MKIAVFSDSHGNTESMLHAVRVWQPDLILHLGDHALDAEELRAECGIQTRYVKGNCDLASAARDSDIFEYDGVKIMMCHGHRHRVKMTLDSLLNAAWFSHADIVLYGHTHIAHLEDMDGLLVINPGSIGTGRRPSWAKLEINDGVPQAEIVYLDAL